jgi:hypothetical protein
MDKKNDCGGQKLAKSLLLRRPVHMFSQLTLSK